MPRILRSKLFRPCVGFILFILSTALIPRWWCGIDGNRYYEGDSATVTKLARAVAISVQQDLSTKDFTSDSTLFRREWMFGTYQMGALGLLQVCLEHPESKGEFLPAAEAAIEHLLSPEIRSFDKHSWGEDPLDSLGGDKGHAAYLGYLNLVLVLHRRVQSESRYAALNDRISNALARRLRTSATGILQTYPEEAYPVDNASVLSSLLLHQRYFNGQYADVTADMLVKFHSTWRDPVSGLLHQSINARDGSTAIDSPRASGTALAAYFLGLADRDTSALLHRALKQSCAGSVAGFGFLWEFPRGTEGKGDIDSGPVVFGLGPSATGFTIASARIQQDRVLFVQLYRSAHLIGAPFPSGQSTRYVTGGPLGNAILLAMFTAPASLQ